MKRSMSAQEPGGLPQVDEKGNGKGMRYHHHHQSSLTRSSD
jgi:hypothetical protein